MLALRFTISLVASGPNQAKACSGTSLAVLELCYNKCAEFYPGSLAAPQRSACYLGCKIGCIIYGTD